LAYIAYLLCHPREEVHVVSLASRADGAQGEADESAESTVEGQSAQPGLTVGRMGDAGEMLNAQVGNIGLEHSNGARDQQYDDTQRNGSLHHSE
jgi:hypothetical protein